MPGLGERGAFPVAESLVWILFPREAVKHVRPAGVDYAAQCLLRWYVSICPLRKRAACNNEYLRWLSAATAWGSCAR